MGTGITRASWEGGLIQDPLGEDGGHIGIKTVYNGLVRYYNFGRYYGMYKDAWVYDGPNVLRRESSQPYFRTYAGYDSFEFKITKDLDNLISQKFREKWDSGQSDFPKSIKEKLSDKPDSIKLAGSDRYMGSDWGLTGPNCVTFTFNTLYEGLNDVIDGDKNSDGLKCEAKEVKDKVEDIEGWSLSPEGILENFEGSSWESSYYGK